MKLAIIAALVGLVGVLVGSVAVVAYDDSDRASNLYVNAEAFKQISITPGDAGLDAEVLGLESIWLGGDKIYDARNPEQCTTIAYNLTVSQGYHLDFNNACPNAHFIRFVVWADDTEIEYSLSADAYLHLLADDYLGNDNWAPVDFQLEHTGSLVLPIGVYGFDIWNARTYGGVIDFVVSCSGAGCYSPPLGDIVINDPKDQTCDFSIQIPVGETVNGEWTGKCNSNFRGGSYARYYQFELEESAIVRVSLKSEVDTYLYVFSNDGRVFEDDDISDTNHNSVVERKFDAGTWFIEVTTYHEGATGAFELAVEETDGSDIQSTNSGSEGK